MSERLTPVSYFYPRPPRGGRLAFPPFCRSGETFLSTPSARRATIAAVLDDNALKISIHALREEGDRGCAGTGRPSADFYPRPPRGGRPMRCATMPWSC